MGRNSEHLRHLSEIPENERAIFNAFYETARASADRKIGARFKSRISPSEIASSALRLALSTVAKGGLQSPTSRDFEKHLLTIVKKKVYGRLTDERAQKRAVDAEVQATSEAELGADDHDPAEIAAAKEVAVDAALRMWKSIPDRRSDDVRLIVVVLGVLYQFDAAAIKASLNRELPGQSTPALRTMREWIQLGRDAMLKAVDESGSEEP